MAKISPFEYVKAVGESRDDPVAEGKLDFRDYNPFMVARAVGLRVDAAPAVNFVNRMPGLTRMQHYLTLKTLVPPRRPRSGEYWPKSKRGEDVKFVSSHMGVGDQRAREIVWAIGEDGVAQMRKSADAGGR